MSIRRTRQILAAFLLVAAGTLISLNVFGQRTEPKPVEDVPRPVPKFSVVEAVKSLTRGSVIHADDIALRETTVAPTPGTVTNLAEAIERVAMRNIAPDEFISDANTAAAFKGVRLSELVPPGLRAIAIHVTDESSVANLVRPGDRVDVLLVSNAARIPQTGNQLFPPAETVTVLQNVPVLAVGETTVGGGSNTPANRNVTLAVTPEQAAMVAMLRTVGNEYLSLRSRTDENELSIATISTEDLRPQRTQSPPPVRQATRPRATRSIEIIAGASANTSRIAVEGGK